MISKELLQRLNNHLTIDEIVSTDNNKIDNNIYWRVKELDILQCKNVYELVHICKEWAFEEGFAISSAKMHNSYYVSIHRDNFRGPKIKEINAKTESEAIFAACEWILGTLKDKNETK